MLRTPTPFPQVGSFGLYHHEGLCRLARIVARDRDGGATISLPERADAGGNLTVPLSTVKDGTPLDAAEQAELRQLQIDCHPFLTKRKRARTPKQKAAMARLYELDARTINARLLAEKIEQHELRQRAKAA